jgi:hypothetical protein
MPIEFGGDYGLMRAESTPLAAKRIRETSIMIASRQSAHLDDPWRFREHASPPNYTGARRVYRPARKHRENQANQTSITGGDKVRALTILTNSHDGAMAANFCQLLRVMTIAGTACDGGCLNERPPLTLGLGPFASLKV